MYSVVLATMLTAGSAAPDFGFHGGCFGCYGCYGCGGNAFSCYGCSGCWGCGGCAGCWGGCGGCAGCWGGCFGCSGCYGGGGCWGSGWGGCFGCAGSYGCYGSYSGFGGVMPVPAGSYTGGGGGGYGPGPGAPPRMLPPPAQETRVSPNAARVIVRVPAGATVTVNGRQIEVVGTEQVFVTPDLNPGRRYTYMFVAEAVRDSERVTLRKRVTVEAGREAIVDLRELRPTSQAQPVGNRARVTVRLPADARLLVDGALCPLTSGERTFTTPPLEAGRGYYYTLTAEVVRDGQARSRSRRIDVEAGKDVTVEFKDLPVQAARR